MLRTTIAALAGKAARRAARIRGGGAGGSALPGLVAEKVDPGFLANALADVPDGIVVVSGMERHCTGGAPRVFMASSGWESRNMPLILLYLCT